MECSNIALNPIDLTTSGVLLVLIWTCQAVSKRLKNCSLQNCKVEHIKTEEFANWVIEVNKKVDVYQWIDGVG